MKCKKSGKRKTGEEALPNLKKKGNDTRVL